MISMSDESYYEIEYEHGPLPGVGKYVKKPAPEKIAVPAPDEIRALFARMRDIARLHRARYDYARFFDRRVQHENALIFYKQALFMADFTDDFAGNAPFSQYFPSYQMMGYEQLRTYFTWRSRVRAGEVAATDLSYAFLYIYELLAGVGVEDAQDGLNRLLAFRQAYAAYDGSLEKYLIRWLKDYHIYYELPWSFAQFIEKHGLSPHYPEIDTADPGFILYSAISKYDIRKSAFYTDENSALISDCFVFVLEKIKQAFAAAGIPFDTAFFSPTRKLMPWKPFGAALFHDWLTQADRRIVLSEHEIYIHKGNKWAKSAHITSDKGKRFIAYVMKRLEVELRILTKYRHKLRANLDMVHADTLRVLNKAGLYIERIVPAAVLEFHREANKTVVAVDQLSLMRIRADALMTQEALIVEDMAPAFAEVTTDDAIGRWDSFADTATDDAAGGQDAFADAVEDNPTAASDGWDALREALDDSEAAALALILNGTDIKIFAAERGIMPEVLVDGINEKAIDHVGDSIIDGDFALYEEYAELCRNTFAPS